MFFTFLIFCLSDTTDTTTLKHDINYFRYCAETDIVHHIISPRNHDFVISLISKSETTTNITYSHPIGTSPKPFDFENPSYRFPGGDAEITVNLKQGECVNFAYASILTGSCAESFIVDTNQQFKYNFTSEFVHTDSCVFYAPAIPESESVTYKINGNPGDNIFYTYDREMVHGPCLVFSKNMNITQQHFESSKPLIFRIESTDNTIPALVTVSDYTTEISGNSLQYSKEIQRVAVEETGILSHNYLLPILGTAPAVLLALAWFYAFARICHKKPKDEIY